MQLIVFGASGATGKQMVEQAVAAGHRVTAFVRSATFSAPGAEVIVGNVLDQAAVTAAIRGHDAVFSTLGTRPWAHEDICSQGMRVITAAMAEAGVKRIIAISSLGVGDSSVGTLATPLVWLMLRKSFRDKGVMEQALAQTDLDWTVIRPGMLTNGKPRGTWKTGDVREIVGGKIARADVAAFALREFTDNAWLRKRPGIHW